MKWKLKFDPNQIEKNTSLEIKELEEIVKEYNLVLVDISSLDQIQIPETIKASIHNCKESPYRYNLMGLIPEEQYLQKERSLITDFILVAVLKGDRGYALFDKWNTNFPNVKVLDSSGYFEKTARFMKLHQTQAKKIIQLSLLFLLATLNIGLFYDTAFNLVAGLSCIVFGVLLSSQYLEKLKNKTFWIYSQFPVSK